MALSAGTRLGSYEVLGPLGAGGMGEVYRATDTNLNRDVAIKVLPPEFGQDRERLRRFRREAHLLAALNHPSIAAIYGLEEADGKPFLALELVEGEDLSERLGRGAIPGDEAIEIAEQIAEALEEAHGKGIVHRDLKPANIKLTPDGKVKVLDFGLAKAWAGDAGEGASSASISQSPTLGHTATAIGVILGTAAYMSPEQARGKPVDERADVWSFGVLLWEMLTGRALFAGDTVTDVIAAVVTKEPDLDALPATTPAAVRRLLGRCLRKDPRTRWPDIGAARLELQDVIAGAGTDVEASTPVGGEARAAPRRLTRERWPWAALVLALVLAGVSAFLALQRLTEAPEARPAAHFVLDTPEDLAFGEFSPVVVSPDGRSIAFVGHPPTGTAQLWIRPLQAPEVRALPGTEGARQPFWSPDGASIAFFTERELKKLVLASGTVQRICALPEVGLAVGTWNREGTIVFSTGNDVARLYSVSAAGGEARPITTHDESRGETAHWSPQFLPDGRQFLFVIGGTEEESTGIYAASLDAPGERRRIAPGYARVVYAAPGHLLFVRDGTLLAQRFDVDDTVTMGEAVPIASAVGAWIGDSNWGSFSVSATGLVAWTSGVERRVRLEWLGRKGERLGTLGEPAEYGQIALSPDDRRVAVEIADREGRVDIWVMDVARGVASRVTTESAGGQDPVWSPDGQELIFAGGGAGGDLYRKELRAGATASPLLETAERAVPEDWSRDGKTLLYLVIGEDRVVWALPLEEDGAGVALKAGLRLDEPQTSPDGRWLAYVAGESGGSEVYVEPFRRDGETVRVSTNGGGQPKWRGDGKELFYLSPDGALMAVDVGKGPTGAEVGIPTTLVAAADLRAVVRGPDYDDYAVTADGQRFLVKSPDQEDRQQIHVLLNWPSLLE